MKQVLLVIGTRPEAIKMMPVVKALRKSDRLRTIVAVTGQHRQMLDQVFSVFSETPDLDLNLMAHNQTLADITSNVVLRMSQVLTETRPDVVLVHGDTTTAMAAAMAGFYARIPVGHVEAGLRTHDLQRPWPEEFNRVVIDPWRSTCSRRPSSARDNLLAEYNRKGRILVTGNTGIDSLLHVSEPDRSRRGAAQNAVRALRVSRQPPQADPGDRPPARELRRRLPAHLRRI